MLKGLGAFQWQIKLLLYENINDNYHYDYYNIGFWIGPQINICVEINPRHVFLLTHQGILKLFK